MRFHLFPFRTEKLSSLTPMVLRLSRGRVGSRLFKVRSKGLTFFCVHMDVQVYGRGEGEEKDLLFENLIVLRRVLEIALERRFQLHMERRGPGVRGETGNRRERGAEGRKGSGKCICPGSLRRQIRPGADLKRSKSRLPGSVDTAGTRCWRKGGRVTFLCAEGINKRLLEQRSFKRIPIKGEQGRSLRGADLILDKMVGS